MSDRSPFQEKLIDYIEDAHALEQHARDGYTAEHLEIAASWDLALDMSLEQEGLHGAPPMGEPGSMAGTTPPEPGTAR